MDERSELTAADAALDALRDEAVFAEAQHGRVHGETLLRYREELVVILTGAFDELSQANDLSLPKRQRIALRMHAVDVAKHIRTDVDALRERHRELVRRQEPSAPGAKYVFAALANRAVAEAGVWWDGRLRLGTLSSAEVARRPVSSYRPLPTWLPWAAGAGVAGAAAVPVISIFLM